jgi:hypothetical protein
LSRSRRGLELQIEHLQARVAESVRHIERLSRPNIIEPAPENGTCLIEQDAIEESDLCGYCLLYVGGRPQTVCKLKEWVSKHNGALLHHDGGIEQSAGMLGDLARQADIVLFPVDCVSHGAIGTVKKLCESYGKRLCPLRTASVSAFQRAIGSLTTTSRSKNRTVDA